jgi:sulfate permease, SulP family
VRPVGVRRPHPKRVIRADEDHLIDHVRAVGRESPRRGEDASPGRTERGRHASLAAIRPAGGADDRGGGGPLSVSSTSTISVLTADALVEAGAADDPGRAAATASLLALLVAGILVAAGLLRLGFLADFISSPVLAGFKSGMGLVIAASQLGKVLGVPVEGGNFFAQAWSALRQLGDANPATVALALGGLAVLLGLRRWAPRVPGPLVVVVVGIALVGLADLEERGVALVGPVSGGLPRLELPDLAGAGALLPAAAGIALMSFTDSISAARAFAARTDPPLDADRELLALGAANLGAGLFQAYPAGGAPPRPRSTTRPAPGRGPPGWSPPWRPCWR